MCSLFVTKVLHYKYKCKCKMLTLGENVGWTYRKPKYNLCKFFINLKLF